MSAGGSSLDAVIGALRDAASAIQAVAFLNHLGRRIRFWVACAAVAFSLLPFPAEPLAAASPQGKSTTQGAAVSKVDACSLLTEGEIQSALGETLRGTKPSTQSAGRLRVSQCVFLTSVPAKSVSLAVTTSAGPHGSVHEFWQNTFHSQDSDRDSRIRNSPASKAAAASEASEADAEESSAPRRIEGLGDEAYWVGNHITGALYILRGDRFVRLSVGGISSESARLAKARTLGAAALARLRG